jgi:predicted alpha-1,2-mannosidase
LLCVNQAKYTATRIMRLFKAFIVALFAIPGASLFAQVNTSNLSYVDPSIGGVGLILEPGRPVVHLPNSMMRVYPWKKDQLDDQISTFPLNVASHRVAWVFSFLPVAGDSPQRLWDKRFTILNEKLTPYNYAVTGEDDGTTIQFSPTQRCGYFEMVFNGSQKHYLRLGLWGATGQVEVMGKRSFSGEESFSGMKAYFYAETDADISNTTYRDPSQHKQLLANFGSAETVGFKYGISYISVDQAKQNLRREIPGWGISKVRDAAYAVWDKKLSQINVEGGTPAQKRVFYTSLYRSLERMVDINEYGKYYSAFDHKVHESAEPFFVDNWMWDQYIALEPLHTVLDPKQEQQKLRSYVDMYRQGGNMPSFAVLFGDWPAMTGNYTAAWMNDAWHKGLRDFDIKTAYEGLKKNSINATLLPWRNGPPTKLDTFYNKNGYFPSIPLTEKETEKEVDTAWERRQAVSVTLATSFSDWSIAQLAEASGNPRDKTLFIKRAGNYKNVFRQDKGILWPKNDKGEWIEPYNPKSSGREYFTENNAYTYNWDVKHDLKGLFNLMGGVKGAEAKLDNLFREDLGASKFQFWATQPDASGLVGQFVMGNEPSFHIPYLYNYMGSPWKTQKRIRMLLDTWYTDNLFGLPGDEDGGGMTAFVVFSMMGFFPVTPGVPVYNIGSPVFTKVTISLPNGKLFTINAKNSSAENKYIQSATLNGQILNKPWFNHTDLVNGATLNLVMGDKPNRNWGSSLQDAPPSYMDYTLNN